MRWIRHAMETGRYALLASLAILVSGAGSTPIDGEPPEYIREALTPFRSPPDSAEVAELLSRWQGDGGLETAHERVLAARLWRRAGEARAAVEWLGALPETGPAGALARLERARVGLELEDGGGAVRSPASDWRTACRALGSLSPDGARRLRAQFWNDIGLLATPDEREAWRTLDDDEACGWLESLFEERAFRMAITPDERLARHYERLATARRYFYLDRPRFYVGMTHWHGRRDGEWMDDRGLIYVRMGPPDETQSCGAVLPFSEDPFQGDLLATCWIYDRPEGYKLYFFSTRDKVTQRVSADGDYYLQESLGPRAHPSDPYFRRYVRHADIPRSLIRHLSFSRTLNLGDAFDAGLDAAEDQAYRRQMEVATRRFADEALIEIPDVPAVTGVEMLWEPLRFLNPGDGRWQVWVVASVPAGQLRPRRSAGSWVYEAGARLATGHPDGLRIDSTSNRAVVADRLPDDAGLPLRTFAVADPGPLPITLSVADRARAGAGAWVQDTVTVPRILPLPTVSDVAVAQSTGGAWTRDGETFLRVSPDHVTNDDGEIHVYFEVYGVRRTAQYDVELRLTPSRTTDDVESVFDLDPSEVPFLLEFTDTMPYERIGRHALRLDLSKTPPGEYDLAIRVRDVDTDTRGLPSVTPVIVLDPEASD